MALRCGFSSHAHFSRVFRERYGMSPSDAIAGRSALPAPVRSQADEI
ncbi:AraC family transcriptional regulator [Paraburkholderia sp. 2C]